MIQFKREKNINEQIYKIEELSGAERAKLLQMALFYIKISPNKSESGKSEHYKKIIAAMIYDLVKRQQIAVDLNVKQILRIFQVKGKELFKLHERV